VSIRSASTDGVSVAMERMGFGIVAGVSSESLLKKIDSVSSARGSSEALGSDQFGAASSWLSSALFTGILLAAVVVVLVVAAAAGSIFSTPGFGSVFFFFFFRRV